MNALYPLRPGEQDCRDYLRTGRCKYGDSCKYNHPLNVESGGGLSDGGPLPSRPGEAPCHYFLKHGICKFGQSCKFDHPSGVERGTAGLAASNNMGGTGTGGGQTAVASSSGVVYVTDPATGATTVQVLPQRPNEPDCIYFLRNGRCKYGSICKFHHPLPGSTQTAPTIRQVSQIPAVRPQVQVQQGVTYALAPQTVQYVQQSPQRLQPIREQVQPQQATHVLLPDGQIAVILDPQSLQNVSELNVQDRPKFYLSQSNGTVGSLTSVEQNKNRTVQVHSPVLTATTTASSTNNSTIGSNLDLWGTTVRVPHKSTSGGSLSIESGNQYQGDPIHPSQSQVSFRTSNTSSPDEFLGAQQDDTRARASSLGSGTLDQQGYYWPSNSSMASVQTDHGPIGTGFRSAPGPGGVANRSMSFDIAERTASFSAPPNGHRHHQHTPSSDEGLSKMTSSLLTLIDRPVDGDVTPNAANTTYIRPPPGMMMNQTVPSQIDNSSESSSGGGNNGNASYPYSYFVGGYDQTPRF